MATKTADKRVVILTLTQEDMVKFICTKAMEAGLVDFVPTHAILSQTHTFGYELILEYSKDGAPEVVDTGPLPPPPILQ